MSLSSEQGKACLSKEQAMSAFEMERNAPRWKVAIEFHCCDKTLQRMYKRYGLTIPSQTCKTPSN